MVIRPDYRPTISLAQMRSDCRFAFSNLPSIVYLSIVVFDFSEIRAILGCHSLRIAKEAWLYRE
jgi:hypothetical protein